MDVTSAWRTAFESWPEKLPRTGIVVTSTQETIPFVDFLIGESFVVVERDKPDSQGARKLIIALAAITAVKLLATEELKALSAFAAGKADDADDGFGVPSGLASRAAAAVRRTSTPSRSSF